MERNITGYHLDDQEDWVAELTCGHNQHVRHRPPFNPRPWVMDEEGRASRIATPLDCPLCERAELPETARLARSTATWDQDSMPGGLRRAHRLGPGMWGQIVLHEGRLAFSAQTTPPINVVLDAGSTQAIPPEIEHHVQPLGHVCFHLDLYTIERDQFSEVPHAPDSGLGTEEGGDPACWAGLVCPTCGNLVNDLGHRRDCPESLDN